MTTMRWFTALALGLALVAGGVGVGVAMNDGGDGAAPAAEDGEGGENEGADSDQPLSGSDAERAAAAALEHVGDGEVLEVEAGDDGAAFGVEIRRADGSEVEVHVDTDFTVIGDEPDDD
jgi:hypothetical protein